MKLMNLNIQMFADGKVVIETDLNDNGFKKGLDKMQSIAKTGFKAIATSVGVASTAIAGIIGKAVTMAGDLEQQIGGTEAVFGKFASTVQDKAAKAFDQMGLSANDFMATANKMGALMQGSGLSIEDSMNLSTQAMQRAADVASIMGIDVQMAMDSVAGAAKGNFTMMDNLGVAMNATTIEEYALSKGIEESYANMDNATKVGLAMEMFLEKTAYAAGNYAKENKTFAGSFNTLKAATSNFLSGSGGIEDVADALKGFSEILIESIIEVAPRVIDGIVEIVNVVIAELPALFETIVPTVIASATTLITTLISSLIEMLPQILQMGITLLLELVKGISNSLPELIPAIVDAVVLMAETLIDNIDLIIDAAIQLVIGIVEGLLRPDSLAKIVTAGIQLIVSLIYGILSSIPKILALPVEIILGLVEGFKEGWNDLKEAGKELISGLWQGIQDKWNGLKQKVADLAGGIVNKFKSVFGIHSPSKVFADEIGSQLSAGLGVGFEDELDNVYRDMQKAVDLETEKMSANVQASGTYQMAMSGLPTFNLLDNSEHSTQLVVNGKVLAEVVNTENRNREVATS